MSDIFNSIKEKQLEIEEMMKTQGREALIGYYSEFFDSHPEVEAIRWVQYTPYFNDGDACTFNIYEPELRLNDGTEKEDGEDLEDDGDVYSYGESKNWFSQYDFYEWDPETQHLPYRDRKQIKKPLYDPLIRLYKDMQTNQKVFEMVFGDHSQITATREGFEVEEYHHD